MTYVSEMAPCVLLIMSVAMGLSVNVANAFVRPGLTPKGPCFCQGKISSTRCSSTTLLR